MKVVLVAEDHPVVRVTLVALLETFGIFTVVAVENGKKALEYLETLPPHVTKTLLITDWDMPEMTGIELVHAIRADARLKKTPIIMTSGRTPEEIASALSLGVDAFIDKPAPTDQLEDLVHRYLDS
jgi:two-component system chemotaxis response regulator CheY